MLSILLSPHRATATVLVQRGILKKGAVVVAGSCSGKVRTGFKYILKGYRAISDPLEHLVPSTFTLLLR